VQPALHVTHRETPRATPPAFQFFGEGHAECNVPQGQRGDVVGSGLIRRTQDRLFSGAAHRERCESTGVRSW
jgi:hypothetical protein